MRTPPRCSSSWARIAPAGGCQYLKNLEGIDLDVLEQIVASCYATLSAGTYTHRARESGA